MTEKFYTLQQGLLKDLNGLCFPDSESNLVTLSDSASFLKGGTLSTLSFFNGFSVRKWKDNTIVDNLYFQVTGEGKFEIKLHLSRKGHAKRLLDSRIVTLKSNENYSIDIESFENDLEDGIISAEFMALEDSTLLGFEWQTTTSPKNHIKLGLVITHFNRKAYVIPAIERLVDSVVDNDVELYIVDNSNNLTETEAAGAKVIPNENFGGAGGFTRGLLEAKSEGCTHVLFMDDDASCEPESILRTKQILRFANDSSVAIAGALLQELEPYTLIEKGAQFDGMCHPLKVNLDMRLAKDLVWAEIDDKKPHYGGWWFFAFSLEQVENLAYPFFVRGDDVMFSITNKFNIVTMNGIASWADDFALKSAPLPTYLDTRNHLVQMLSHLGSSRKRVAKVMTHYFLNNAFSHNYASAEAVIKAMTDVFKGKQFWVDNLDTAKVRGEVAGFGGEEKLRPIKRSDYPIVYKTPEEGVFRKALRMLSLNGFLLPSFVLKDTVVFQHKSFRGSFREVFGHKKVLYEYEPLSLGYVVEYDRKRFFRLLYQFVIELAKLQKNYKQLRSEYKIATDELTKQDFWFEALKMKEGKK
ncbi:glycosyltransferase family 2 protein [Vibrio sp. WXL103]|uniref:glycosyltransferase family 2 protein n=1 Tax=Vibrio sp. WXL103 TaxID=3450710 RepID=UPI003EC72CEB